MGIQREMAFPCPLLCLYHNYIYIFANTTGRTQSQLRVMHYSLANDNISPIDIVY